MLAEGGKMALAIGCILTGVVPPSSPELTYHWGCLLAVRQMVSVVETQKEKLPFGHWAPATHTSQIRYGQRTLR